MTLVCYEHSVMKYNTSPQSVILVWYDYNLPYYAMAASPYSLFCCSVMLILFVYCITGRKMLKTGNILDRYL